MAGRNTRQKLGTGTNILLAIILTIFIFTAAVVFVLNFKWLYYLDIALLGIEKQSGLDVASIKANYDTLIRYNQFWFFGELQFPTLVMSDTGRIHFQEVKTIFTAVQILCMISFVAAIIGIFKKARRRQFGYLKITGLTALAVPTLLGITALLNWNGFFEMFHKIFFRNNYWLFDPKTDPVILILPDAYFMHCAVLILLLIFFASMICLRLEKWLRGQGRKRSR